MFIYAPMIFTPKDAQIEKSKDNKQIYGVVSSSIWITGGTFCFVWFLIDYIRSFGSYEELDETGKVVAIGYDFNPDSMLIFLLGGFLVVLGVLSLIKLYKHRFSPLFATSVGLIIVSSSFIYCLARLIRMYVKKKDPTTYWMWFGIGLFTIAVFLALVIYFYLQKKKKTSEASQSA